jgi:hypothetical protein
MVTSVRGDVCIYKIDSNDNLLSCSGRWCDFAKQNGAADLCETDSLTGSSIYSFISGYETAHLYNIIINKVRTGNKEISIPFRCDSPGIRRFMQMLIKPLPNNEVAFKNTIIRIEHRKAIKLLDSHSQHTKEQYITICSYCKKIRINEDVWVSTEEGVKRLKIFDQDKQPYLTHGICPQCYQNIMDSLDIEENKS